MILPVVTQLVIWLNGWELLTLTHHPTRLYAYRSYGSGDITFLISHVTLCDHMIKGHITLWEPSFNPRSPLCQVWCLQVLCKWRRNVSKLSRDIIPSHDQMDIWDNIWEHLNLSHYSVRFNVNTPYGIGDMACHVASCDHIFKGACSFISVNPPTKVITLLSLMLIGLMQVKICF